MKKLISITMAVIAVFLVSGCENEEIIVVGGVEPALPTGVYSTTLDRAVTVHWRANNDNGLTEGYGVYQYIGSVGNSDEYELIGTVDADDWDRNDGYNDDVIRYSFTVGGLTNGDDYYFAVNAYNEYGESDLSWEDAMDTPRPQGTATLHDFWQYPGSAGFDFSDDMIRHYENAQTDIYFEYDVDLGAYFVFAAGYDVFIQVYGYTNDITDVNWGETGGGWSQVGWMELLVGYSYIIYIDRPNDKHYAAFRVLSLGSGSIQIQWSYQTQWDWPELKRRVFKRPDQDENYGRRKG